MREQLEILVILIEFKASVGLLNGKFRSQTSVSNHKKDLGYLFHHQLIIYYYYDYNN